MNNIVFTGGGSAGHVSPNLALIDHFRQAGWQTSYIGSKGGIEQQMIAPLNIPYHSIETGKLRRYFSWDNFLTPFKVCKGIWDAYRLIKQIKPDVIFSKGGFVAFPVVLAGWLNRVPTVIHEADITPGLANRLSMPFASNICLTFPEAEKHYKKSDKIKITGIPLRPTLHQGNAEKGRTICGFNQEKPIILVVGGSLGAQSLNRVTREMLPQLLEHYQIAHICGNNKTDSTLDNQAGYKQFAFLNDDYADILAAADLVISRSGANAIYELLSLKKPHILVPLPTTGSRGDQIVNAEYYQNQGLSTVINDEDLNPNSLGDTIQSVFQDKSTIIQRLSNYPLPNSVALITDMLKTLAKKS